MVVELPDFVFADLIKKYFSKELFNLNIASLGSPKSQRGASEKVLKC